MDGVKVATFKSKGQVIFISNVFAGLKMQKIIVMIQTNQSKEETLRTTLMLHLAVVGLEGRALKPGSKPSWLPGFCLALSIQNELLTWESFFNIYTSYKQKKNKVYGN